MQKQKKSNLRQVGPPVQHDGIEIRVQHDAQGTEPMFLFTLTGKVPVHALVTLEEAERFWEELDQALDLAALGTEDDDITEDDDVPW